MRIDDFQLDEGNEAEMARHGVMVAEVLQVLRRGDFRLARNKGPHAERQPYIMIGRTDGGRELRIPIGPVVGQPGVWRPATAF